MIIVTCTWIMHKQMNRVIFSKSVSIEDSATSDKERTTPKRMGATVIIEITKLIQRAYRV